MGTTTRSMQGAAACVAALLLWPLLTSAQQLNVEQQMAHLPRILIIGAQKGGTTFLRSSLHKHQDIGGKCSRNGGKAVEDGFLMHYPWTDRELTAAEDAVVRSFYAAHFYETSCGGPFNIDTKPEYMAALPAAGIANAVRILPPNAIFVVAVRDPVERMVSAMSMTSCALGTEANACLVPKQLAYASTRPLAADMVAHDDFVVQFGLYARHLERWLQHVPRNRMHIFLHEQIVDSPLAVLNHILREVGLKEFGKMPSAQKKPEAQVNCRLPACSKLRSRYTDHVSSPEVCPRLEALFRPENERLVPLAGSTTPLQWSLCPQSPQARLLEGT